MIRVDFEMPTPKILAKFVNTADHFYCLLFNLIIIPFFGCHVSGMKSDSTVSILNNVSGLGISSEASLPR